jgi:hypothetical protein
VSIFLRIERASSSELRDVSISFSLPSYAELGK